MRSRTKQAAGQGAADGACAVPRGQALLDEWRAELARKPLGMGEAEACAILEIQFDNGGASAGGGGQEAGMKLEEETLKAAYRRLARRCVFSCDRLQSYEGA